MALLLSQGLHVVVPEATKEGEVSQPCPNARLSCDTAAAPARLERRDLARARAREAMAVRPSEGEALQLSANGQLQLKFFLHGPNWAPLKLRAAQGSAGAT